MAFPPTWVLLGRKCPSGLPQVDCSTEAKLLSLPLDIGKIRNAAVWLFLPAISTTQCKTPFSRYHTPQVFKRPLCNFCKVAGSFCLKLSGCLLCSVMCPLKHAVSIYGILKLSSSLTQNTCDSFQINQPTRCNNFSSLLLDVYVQLNMFRASSRPSSGAQQLQWQPLVLPLERGDSSVVGRGWPDQRYHHAPTVKPEAATAVVELLMTCVRMPETC